jgi:hypothetical protein
MGWAHTGVLFRGGGCIEAYSIPVIGGTLKDRRGMMRRKVYWLSLIY